MGLKKTRGVSDEVAVLASLGGEFALCTKPERQATNNQCNDCRIEGVTNGDEHSFESPLGELADGCDEFLEIHEATLRSRK